MLVTPTMRQLGKGVYGSVCCGTVSERDTRRQCTASDHVALKSLDSMEDDVEWAREAHAGGVLTPHPHVAAPRHLVLHPAKKAVLVMDLHHSMSQVVRTLGGNTSGVPGLNEAWAMQAFAGLAHAHAGGLMHCDLKSDNFLVSATGDLLVADWGISKSVSAEPPHTASGVAFSRALRSPEIHAGMPPVQADDVFAMSLALISMACGKSTHVHSLLGAKGAAQSPHARVAAVRAFMSDRPPDKSLASRLRSALRRGARTEWVACMIDCAAWARSTRPLAAAAAMDDRLWLPVWGDPPQDLPGRLRVVRRWVADALVRALPEPVWALPAHPGTVPLAALHPGTALGWPAVAPQPISLRALLHEWRFLHAVRFALPKSMGITSEMHLDAAQVLLHLRAAARAGSASAQEAMALPLIARCAGALCNARTARGDVWVPKWAYLPGTSMMQGGADVARGVGGCLIPPRRVQWAEVRRAHGCGCDTMLACMEFSHVVRGLVEHPAHTLQQRASGVIRLPPLVRRAAAAPLLPAVDHIVHDVWNAVHGALGDVGVARDSEWSPSQAFPVALAH